MAITNVAKAKMIDSLLAEYEARREHIDIFRNSLMTALTTSSELEPFVHSLKTRPKDPNHLRDKLERKIAEAQREGTAFDITPENLLIRINDLAGIRILHLYTRQMEQIDPILRKIFDEQSYELIEPPFARTWDDEYREFFDSIGIESQTSPNMYTSVHYVVGSASRTKVTCEIQVRTLMEEVWGEVDHAVNYPLPSGLLACREQLKVLARVTSSATRLVDSIFSVVNEK